MTLKTYEIQVTVQQGYKYLVEAENEEHALDKYYDWTGVKEIRNEIIEELVDYVEEVDND